MQKCEIGVILSDMSRHARPTPSGLILLICTEHGRKSLYFTMGDPFPKNCRFLRGFWTPGKTRFIGPIGAHKPNGVSIGSAVFPQKTVDCPYTSQPDAHSPHLIRAPLGPAKSSTQMASRSVQPFLQGSLVWQTDRQTDPQTERQTTLLGL